MKLKILFFIAIIFGTALAQKQTIEINYHFDDSMDKEMRQTAKKLAERYLNGNNERLAPSYLTRQLETDLTKEYGEKVTVLINEETNKAFGSPHLIWDMIISFRTREELDNWWDNQG